ncbi:MAG: DUF4810 domain-containing protein [Prevotellaceae bacterium]|jgi:hypothetical protein|nr:DUF4810 domain-containing protein [Prevotellaceae bacterium]
MKRLIIFTVDALLLVSCVTTKPLYTWGQYEITSYNYLKNSDEKATKELIATFNQIIEKQRGSRMVAPPGIFADYGFILLQEGKTKEAKAMLLKEIDLYPESAPFVSRILKMIEE